MLIAFVIYLVVAFCFFLFDSYHPESTDVIVSDVGKENPNYQSLDDEKKEIVDKFTRKWLTLFSSFGWPILAVLGLVDWIRGR